MLKPYSHLHTCHTPACPAESCHCGRGRGMEVTGQSKALRCRLCAHQSQPNSRCRSQINTCLTNKTAVLISSLTLIPEVAEGPSLQQNLQPLRSPSLKTQGASGPSHWRQATWQAKGQPCKKGSGVMLQCQHHCVVGSHPVLRLQWPHSLGPQ